MNTHFIYIRERLTRSRVDTIAILFRDANWRPPVGSLDGCEPRTVYLPIGSDTWHNPDP
jgi:hypothetical protein